MRSPAGDHDIHGTALPRKPPGVEMYSKPKPVFATNPAALAFMYACAPTDATSYTMIGFPKLGASARAKVVKPVGARR